MQKHNLLTFQLAHALCVRWRFAAIVDAGLASEQASWPRSQVTKLKTSFADTLSTAKLHFMSTVRLTTYSV